MSFGGDDTEFQKVATRVETRMKGIGGGLDFAINMSFLTRIAQGLGNMGKAAEEMSTKVRLGKADLGDLFEEVAKGVPIIGRFVEAGRGIRELISGEKAYTEVLKQQTEAQNERIKAVNDWIEAMKKLGRRSEDQNRDLAPPGFGKDFSGLAAGVARQTEDLPEQLKKEFEKQLAELAEQRKGLTKKLDALKKANVPVVVTGGDSPGSEVIDPGLGPQIGEVQKGIDKLDEMSRALENAKEKAKDLGKQVIAKGAFNSFGDLIGETFVKGLKSAASAIDQFIPKLPKLASATQQAVDEMGGKFAELQKQFAAFQADFGKGLISQRTLDKINFNALNKSFGADFWKAAGQAVSNGFGNFQAAVDPKIGNTISNVRERMNNILRTFGIGPSFNIPKESGKDLPVFRSSTIGLSDLGRNIQTATLGGDSVDRLLKGIGIDIAKQKDIQQKQLDELKKNKPATVK
jgi:hypothetical protein